MQAKTIPNLITGLRLALTPVLVLLLLNGHFRPAFGLLLLMAFSDALDGFLAKRLGWQSRIGEFIDPLADKLMLVGAFVSLWWVGLLPAWLTALVLGRDAVIVAGGVAYHFCIGRFNARPS
ncbi:MAG: CDP-alcohol phosphatidyltransferase family protein, partial [Gammaproteobacteria bacterium]|nr:CDP-alcohol phosphatidyltransferase family protein [Gammaproteobacteria bacterium]